MSEPNQGPYVGDYKILSKIDGPHLHSLYIGSPTKSSFSLECTEKQTMRNVVIKLIPTTEFQGSFNNECNIFCLKPHKNIIQCIDILKDVDFKEFKDLKFNALILQYFSNGDLLDYIAQSALDENIVRFYLEQILDGLEHLASQGYAHRDLKPDNILLDEEFNAVLTDFGYSAKHSDANGVIIFNGVSSTSTEEIMPPEYFKELGYKAKDLDIFALGKLLLTMATGSVPFTKATKYDQEYSLIMNGNWTSYWKWIAKILRRRKELSSGFKRLIEGMLEPNPCLRFMLRDVRESLWYQSIEPITSGELRKKMAQIRN